MYLKNIIIPLVIGSGLYWSFTSSAHATQGVDAPEVVQDIKTMPHGLPPLEEHKIDMHPFFLLQRKGSHIWLERVIVTVMMAAPKDSLKHDMNSPNFRKMIYDLLQSGKPETTVQEEAGAILHCQLGMNVEANVHLSRSVIIVR